MSIYTADVKPGAKVLYLYLKENPGIYPQAELAYETGMTTQSINAYVQDLKEKKLLKVKEVPHTRRFLYEVTGVTGSDSH